MSSACSVIKISTTWRPARSGREWVCANSPGTTRAPSRASPVCGTSEPASSRRNVVFPDPFAPSTATRSPYHTSAENAEVFPVSASSEQITARLPVRPPRSRIRTFWSRGASSGGPASSKRVSRVTAAWSRDAMSALYEAFCRSVRTSSLSFSCSSSQRRRSSSSREIRSARACA